MRPPLVRLAVGLVGLAVCWYGLAALTGGWLGTPPWGNSERSFLISAGVFLAGGVLAVFVGGLGKPCGRSCRPSDETARGEADAP